MNGRDLVLSASAVAAKPATAEARLSATGSRPPPRALEVGIVKTYELVAAVDTVAIAPANLTPTPTTPTPRMWDVIIRP